MNEQSSGKAGSARDLSSEQRARVQEWYRATLPTLEAFRAEVHRQLDAIVNRDEIPLAVPLQSRVKSFESIIKKLDDKPNLRSQFEGIEDLCGLRIIVLFRDDVERAVASIRNRFGKDVVVRKKVATGISFDYTSVHCITPVPREWLRVPTMTEFKGLRAEVQIRTVAQHTWAAASHELQYKNPMLASGGVHRALAQLSAILENVDDALLRILAERNAYRAAVEAKTAMDSAVLDIETLPVFLQRILPRENYDEVVEIEDARDLFLDLREHGYRTFEDVRNLWGRQSEAVLQLDRELAQQALAGDLDVSKWEPQRWSGGSFMSFGGLLRTAIEKEHPDESIHFTSRFDADDDT